jgi:hypothetical protein
MFAGATLSLPRIARSPAASTMSAWPFTGIRRAPSSARRPSIDISMAGTRRSPPVARRDGSGRCGSSSWIPASSTVWSRTSPASRDSGWSRRASCSPPDRGRRRNGTSSGATRSACSCSTGCSCDRWPSTACSARSCSAWVTCCDRGSPTSCSTSRSRRNGASSNGRRWRSSMPSSRGRSAGSRASRPPCSHAPSSAPGRSRSGSRSRTSAAPSPACSRCSGTSATAGER